MPFKSGEEWNGNRNGRPKNSEAQELRDALSKVGKEKRKPFLEHCAEKAYQSEAMAIAILKKLVPDLTKDEGIQDLIRTIIIRPKQ